MEPIARCFDDSDFDAGSSVDGEIIWSDAYVTAGNRSRLVIDAVPWAQIQDPNWLLYSDTYLMTCFDANGDGGSETCVIPQWAYLDANQSTGISIYDRVNGSWTPRVSTCSGTTTRRAGDHAAIGGTTNSWWQFAIDWSCLLGANSGNVRVQAFLQDWLFTAGDYSPDAYAGMPMNFTTMTNATAPGAPTSVGLTATGGGLAVSWSAPVSDGGAPVVGYTARAFATASGGSPVASCTTTSNGCVISGLAAGTAAWVDVVATNAVGSGGASSPRVAGTPGAASVPGSPTSLAILPASGSLTVRWGAPSSHGGSPVVSYLARAYAQSTGGTAIASCTTTSLQCSITGLTNGQPYWIEVAAANGVGTGAATTPRTQASPAVAYTPTDPYYTSGSLWGLNGTYGVNAPEAWTLTRGSPSTVVAVLDTGSTVHPDLAGTTVPGYDMISSSAVAADGNGQDPDPSDAGDAYNGSGSSWHGTHVAGTINAVASNGLGVVGVAPDVKVQHVRVLGAGGGYTSDILMGITWASGGSVPGIPANPTPAKVINMSLGGYGACSPDWQSKIDDAVARGTTIVVAAGNSTSSASNFSPASCARTVTVAAIGSNGKRASFSNFGSAVEVAAPGAGIWSTLNSGTTTPADPTYASYSGTSMATPHVAGVVALMVSREPGLTPAQISTRLTTPSLLTAFPGGACDPSASMTCGAGIVNAGRLLGVGTPPAATPPGVPSAVSGTTGVGQVTASWSPPATDGGSAITGYTARAFSALSGGSAVGSCTTTNLSCVITGLSAGMSYYLEVVASNVVGTGPASTPRILAATAGVPGAPSSVTATPGPGSAIIGWTAPSSSGGSSVTGYIARAFAAATGGAPLATCTTLTTTCTIVGLVNGTTVYADVVASNAAGTGGPSSPRVAVMPRTVPASPTAVVATPSDRSISTSWTQPSSNGGSAITGYLARAFDAATGGNLLASCAATTTRCTIPGLANGVTAYVEVVASNAAGTSLPSAPRIAATPRTSPAAATGITVTPGASQLTASWAPPTNVGGSAITGYTVRAFTAATGGTLVSTCTTATTTCVLPRLTNGVTYFVDVIASNTAGSGPASSPRVSGVPRTVPAAPTRVGIVPGDTQVAVSWRASAGNGGSPITGYTARAFSAASGGTLIASCTTTGLGCTISGLANGTAVAVEVIATNAAGDSGPTSPRVSATPRTTPGSPTDVAVVAGASQLTVAWTAPASAGGSAITGYSARAFTVPSGGTAVAACTTSGQLTCVIKGLTNGVTYFVEVVGRNAAGPGAASSPRTSGVPVTVPAKPRTVTASAQNAGAVVTWLAPTFDGGTPITGYVARAWSTPTGGAILATCTSASNSCALTGLANGVTTYVDVIAANAVGNGPAPVPRVAVLPRTVPQAPTAVQARFGNGRLDVSWARPASNGGSAILRYTALAFADPASGTPVASCSTTGTACAINGLTNGTPYLVEVTALNAVGPSSPSTRVTETPRAIPGAPSAVQLSAGVSSLTVTWSPPTTNGGSPVTSFTARAFAAAGGGAPIATCTSTETTCVIPQLANGRRYFVDVIATNGVGSSPASPPRVSGIPRTIPSEPIRVQAVPGSGALTVSWASPASNGGAPITGYTARAISGGKPVGTCSTTGLSCVLTGLVNGVPYSVEVLATNAAGQGPTSSPRVLAVPRAVTTTSTPR